MNLAQHITDLALRLAQELKTRVSTEHPGLAKAWVCFGVQGTGAKAVVVLRGGFNIQSVTRLDRGRFRVTFQTPMADAHYCWQAFARNAGKQSSLKFASARVTAEAKTPEFVEVICTTAAGTLSDTTELNLTVWR